MFDYNYTLQSSKYEFNRTMNTCKNIDRGDYMPIEINKVPTITCISYK